MNINSTSMLGWSSDPEKCKCDYIFNPSKQTGVVSFHKSGLGAIQPTVIPNYVCDLCLTHSFPRPPNLGKCILCRMVEHNLKEKVWICYDRRLVSNDNIKFTKWDMDSLEDVSEYAPPMEEYYDNINRPFRKHDKPQGRWFSAGTWLYNPYDDMHSCLENQNTKFYNKVLTIVDPKNILPVTNPKELDAFVSKYHYNADNRYIIDWDKVVEDGYFGVAFTFHDISALGILGERSSFENYQKYYWHTGYDVESLVVWDYRAYNHKLYPVELYTHST